MKIIDPVRSITCPQSQIRFITLIWHPIRAYTISIPEFCFPLYVSFQIILFQPTVSCVSCQNRHSKVALFKGHLCLRVYDVLINSFLIRWILKVHHDDEFIDCVRKYRRQDDQRNKSSAQTRVRVTIFDYKLGCFTKQIKSA